MIQRNALIQWSANAPWKELRYVEQDLVISRSLVSIYSDEYLRSKIAFRGGTAIYKLFLTPPLRYSEDIDFVQIDPEPIGSILDRIKLVLSFLGEPKTSRKESSNSLVYRYNAEEPKETSMRLKIEINTREHFSVSKLESKTFELVNQWFTGKCDITTYQFDELIGTKIRALYQRKKGRDLFDLYMALQSGFLNNEATVNCYKKYMGFSGYHVPSAAEYARNLKEKMSDPNFRIDALPFLPSNAAYDVDKAYKKVCEAIIAEMDKNP